MATSQYFVPFRPTMGLLTTVAELPHNYKIRYIKPESPLDLSVKTITLSAPMTPPSTPSPTMLPFRKRRREEKPAIVIEQVSTEISEQQQKPPEEQPPSKKILVDEKMFKTTIEKKCEALLEPQPFQSNQETTVVSDTVSYSPKTNMDFENIPPKEKTPNKPIRVTTAPKTAKAEQPAKERKHKAVRKLKFDEHKSSPVSGTIIRLLDEISPDDDVVMESGDIDPEYNIVEVTDEVKAEIATIPNVIGGYACKLCRIDFDDVFGLARHRCSCIVLLEYRCPECGKRFNCPANLASHRRWHKPKDEVLKKKESTENDVQFPCSECGKTFKRQAYLRKHLLTHRSKKTGSDMAKEGGSAVNVDGGTSMTVSASLLVSVGKSSECSGSFKYSDNSHSGDSSMERRSDDDGESQSCSTAQQYASTTTTTTATTTTAVDDTRSHFRIFEGAFTEEENMAAAVLAHLRNGPSVIRHTTTMSV